MTDSPARVRDLTLELTRFVSVTDTDGESQFGPWLRDRLLAWPYFRAHPQQVRLLPTLNDLRERYSVAALVRGTGPETVVLTGHYDIVPVNNYGPLAALACDPEALRPRLIQALTTEADRGARQDIAGGEFMPGRGALDMKSGLAAGLAVIERAIHTPLAGSLLLVAVPDEEHNSHGMRSAVVQLPVLAEAWGLQLEAAINLDAETDPGDGSGGRAIFLGSVGKLLPTVLTIGRPTHVGAPFDGVGAGYLAAEVVREIEGSAALADQAGPNPADEMAPPPVCLQMLDLKPGYDVTVPAHAWCAFNLLTHQDEPDAVLERLRQTVQRALNQALAIYQQREQAWSPAAGRARPAAPGTLPRVLTGAELLAGARPEVRAELDRIARDSGLDALAVARLSTLHLAQAAELEGPAAVIGFAPPYYPLARFDHSPQAERLRIACTQAAQSFAAEGRPGIRLRPFFPGISDMSFLGAHTPASTLDVWRANTPGWEVRWTIEASHGLHLPIVNIGPWGRDYHQRTERVHVEYSFRHLPELLWRVCERLFGLTDNTDQDG